MREFTYHPVCGANSGFVRCFDCGWLVDPKTTVLIAYDDLALKQFVTCLNCEGEESEVATGGEVCILRREK